MDNTSAFSRSRPPMSPHQKYDTHRVLPQPTANYFNYNAEDFENAFRSKDLSRRLVPQDENRDPPNSRNRRNLSQGVLETPSAQRNRLLSSRTLSCKSNNCSDLGVAPSTSPAASGKAPASNLDVLIKRRYQSLLTASSISRLSNSSNDASDTENTSENPDNIRRSATARQDPFEALMAQGSNPSGYKQNIYREEKSQTQRQKTKHDDMLQTESDLIDAFFSSSNKYATNEHDSNNNDRTIEQWRAYDKRQRTGSLTLLKFLDGLKDELDRKTIAKAKETDRFFESTRQYAMGALKEQAPGDPPQLTRQRNLDSINYQLTDGSKRNASLEARVSKLSPVGNLTAQYLGRKASYNANRRLLSNNYPNSAFRSTSLDNTPSPSQTSPKANYLMALHASSPSEEQIHEMFGRTTTRKQPFGLFSNENPQPRNYNNKQVCADNALQLKKKMASKSPNTIFEFFRFERDSYEELSLTVLENIVPGNDRLLENIQYVFGMHTTTVFKKLSNKYSEASRLAIESLNTDSERLRTAFKNVEKAFRLYLKLLCIIEGVLKNNSVADPSMLFETSMAAAISTAFAGTMTDPWFAERQYFASVIECRKCERLYFSSVCHIIGEISQLEDWRKSTQENITKTWISLLESRWGNLIVALMELKQNLCAASIDKSLQENSNETMLSLLQRVLTAASTMNEQTKSADEMLNTSYTQCQTLTPEKTFSKNRTFTGADLAELAGGDDEDDSSEAESKHKERHSSNNHPDISKPQNQLKEKKNENELQPNDNSNHKVEDTKVSIARAKNLEKRRQIKMIGEWLAGLPPIEEGPQQLPPPPTVPIPLMGRLVSIVSQPVYLPPKFKVTLSDNVQKLCGTATLTNGMMEVSSEATWVDVKAFFTETHFLHLFPRDTLGETLAGSTAIPLFDVEDLWSMTDSTYGRKTIIIIRQRGDLPTSTSAGRFMTTMLSKIGSGRTRTHILRFGSDDIRARWYTAFLPHMISEPNNEMKSTISSQPSVVMTTVSGFSSVAPEVNGLQVLSARQNRMSLGLSSKESQLPGSSKARSVSNVSARSSGSGSLSPAASFTYQKSRKSQMQLDGHGIKNWFRNFRNR